MNSLSVCIEMYAQSEAEKAVCYRIFQDLRLEHESATNTACDDFTTPSDQRYEDIFLSTFLYQEPETTVEPLIAAHAFPII